MPIAPASRRDEIRDHLRTLFGYDNGGDAPGWVSVFAKRGTEPDVERRCYAVRGDDLFGDDPKGTTLARDLAQLANAGYDVYIGVGLQHDDPGAGRRGTAETVLALPGVWMDLDVAGPNHAQADLPATTEIALDFLSGLRLEPTLVVHSGGGLQAYWCFDELQVIEDEHDRELARLLSRAVQAHITAAGTARGWTLDNTSDLARVLRPTGTLNWKSGHPTSVRALHRSAARYTPTDLLAMCTKPAAPSRTPSTFVQPPATRGEGAADPERRVRAYLAKTGEPWEPGHRDNAAIRAAAFAKDVLKMDKTAALELLRRLNASSPAPLADPVLAEKISRLWAA